MTINDIHTHDASATGAIYNLPSPDAVHDGPVSVGLHPWQTSACDADSIIDAVARRATADKNVVAIGEVGLDARRGADLPRQQQLLRRQIQLSEQLHKPLILHIVGAWSEIIRLKKELQPSMPWIIHGFRGKPALARQLLDAGFYISIGTRSNPYSVEIIPSDRLLLESDEDSATPAPPANYDSSLPSLLFAVTDNQEI